MIDSSVPSSFSISDSENDENSDEKSSEEEDEGELLIIPLVPPPSSSLLAVAATTTVDAANKEDGSEAAEETRSYENMNYDEYSHSSSSNSEQHSKGPEHSGDALDALEEGVWHHRNNSKEMEIRAEHNINQAIDSNVHGTELIDSSVPSSFSISDYASDLSQDEHQSHGKSSDDSSGESGDDNSSCD